MKYCVQQNDEKEDQDQVGRGAQVLGSWLEGIQVEGESVEYLVAVKELLEEIRDNVFMLMPIDEDFVRSLLA